MASSSQENYVNMDTSSLSPLEIARLRQLLLTNNNIDNDDDADSDYTEFAETTHAWAVFADKPEKRATKLDRVVGSVIICFQLFTYYLFAREAIEDYQAGQVQVMVAHDICLATNQAPYQDFACEAEFTSHFDAFVAFFMLSMFLTPDFLQATRAIRDAPIPTPTFFFACLAGIEVVSAYIAATISISYSLWIGEVTDAVEVGVGLLFIRELSTRAYHGIRHKGVKQYKSFFCVLVALVVIGFLCEALYERIFAAA